MAYDEELAERVRGCLGPVEVTERRMFGGLAFLVGGHLAVAASGRGVLMVRCDPGASPALLERPGSSRMVMRGRPLAGWLEVRTHDLDDVSLRAWVDTGTSYAGSLPPK